MDIYANGENDGLGGKHFMLEKARSRIFSSDNCGHFRHMPGYGEFAVILYELEYFANGGFAPPRLEIECPAKMGIGWVQLFEGRQRRDISGHHQCSQLL